MDYLKKCLDAKLPIEMVHSRLIIFKTSLMLLMYCTTVKNINNSKPFDALR